MIYSKSEKCPRCGWVVCMKNTKLMFCDRKGCGIAFTPTSELVTEYLKELSESLDIDSCQEIKKYIRQGKLKKIAETLYEEDVDSIMKLKG